MLPLLPSQTPLASGLVEHECPRCHGPVELPLGTLCGACRTAIERRARRGARWVAIVSTALVAASVWIPPPPDHRGRIVGAVGILVWFTLTTMVVRRALRQWTR